MKFGTIAGTAVLAGVFALPSAPALGADTAPVTVDMWAAFQTPDPWINQADDLHWYAKSPVITQQMTDRTATADIVGGQLLDCAALGAGYVKADVWTNVEFTVSSCDQDRATVTYRVTKDMVGSQVFVNGWSAAANNPVTLRATVTIGTTTARGEVTAKKPAEVEPVVPGTVLGDWNGQRVSFASEAGVNRLWIGSTVVDAPAGEVAKVELVDGVVTLWVRDRQSGGTPTAPTSAMVQWKYDLVSQQAAVSQRIPTWSFGITGEPGFILAEPSATGGYLDHVFHRWDGSVAHTWSTPMHGYPSLVFRGFTADAVVLETTARDGKTLSLTSETGTVLGSETVAVGPMGLRDAELTLLSIEADGFTYRKRAGISWEAPAGTPNPTYICRITQAGRSCTLA